MNLLQKNISQIGLYNPKLQNSLIGHILSENDKFQLFQAQSGDVSLLYNDIKVHNEINPQQEAISSFSQVKNNTENSILIILGLGLGYLFKRAYMDFKGKIIVYEPNLSLLKFTLECVDFEKELSDKRVQIVSCQMGLIKALKEFYNYNSTLNAIWLRSATVFYKDEIDYLKTETDSIINYLKSDYNTISKASYNWLIEGLLNIPTIIKSSNVHLLKGKFKSKPALIVSAGPSLDKNISTIIANRENVVLFCASNAYKTLAKHNIKPDFVAFIDVGNFVSTYNGLDFSGTNLIAPTYVNNRVLGLNKEQKFISYCNNDIISRWLSEVVGFSIGDYRNKGTVSYLALNSAYIMGCNPITLIGQDLAYVEGNCYSKESVYGKAIKCVFDEKLQKHKLIAAEEEEFEKYCTANNGTKLTPQAITELKQKLASWQITSVMGQNGQMMPTSPDYAGFIKYFEEFAYNADSNVELINASTDGAQINGFKNEKLEDVLNKFDKKIEDIKQIIEQVSNLNSNIVYKNSDKIKKEVEKIISNINKYQRICDDGIKTAKQLSAELKRLHKNPIKVNKLINVIINHYVDFKDDLFKKHLILVYCAFEEMLEFTNIIETDSSQAPDLNEIAIKSENFFNQFLLKSVQIKKLCERILSKI
ncbi:MAG: DUF115 domain-containing protein [Candidatus Gastranaerophilales bacterium]|nr:DUF115 domain-containing protein [Candidatus Gastranaerophilales bacterium]